MDRHIPGSIARLAELESTVKWVITMQGANGTLGIPMTPGGERATRIASLLQWGALRLGGDTAGAARAALAKWVSYITTNQGEPQSGSWYVVASGWVASIGLQVVLRAQ